MFRQRLITANETWMQPLADLSRKARERFARPGRLSHGCLEELTAKWKALPSEGQVGFAVQKSRTSLFIHDIRAVPLNFGKTDWGDEATELSVLIDVYALSATLVGTQKRFDARIFTLSSVSLRA
jgi:hypothetical protein